MSETMRCPDCGQENPAGAEACSACGFPLHGEAAGAAPRPIEPPPLIRRRPPRRPPRGSNEATTLWLVFGTFVAVVLIFVGVKSNVDRGQAPVEGASPVQQINADSLRLVIEKDSTNVHARIHLGDLLYDTGNWSEAIVQYRSAIRQDSTQVNALVDLGVCYYNLGDAAEAERHFLLALNREPRQPIALFNLGIVNERRENPKAALDYFHRALEAQPPEEMRQAVVEAMGRVQKSLGAQPRPLRGGSP